MYIMTVPKFDGTVYLRGTYDPRPVTFGDRDYIVNHKIVGSTSLYNEYSSVYIVRTHITRHVTAVVYLPHPYCHLLTLRLPTLYAIRKTHDEARQACNRM